MKAFPIDTAPSNRFVLVKHKINGWIEAMFDPVVYAQSAALGTGGFGWSNPGLDHWLYHKDMIAWAELPVVDEKDAS